VKKAEIIGESRPVKELLALIDRVSKAKTNILIVGESGTGKELVARMIHDSGPLAAMPFIPVNCGAIPENLIESEMFGHKRGSFTGAIADKSGLFEVAHGGTLFLDEVGELPLGMQVKLLRAIQERTIRRVGDNRDIRVDVRIIAATNRDLEAATAKGMFREDLYYRLNVIQIRTPPLREREGDVRILAEHFLKRFAQRAGKPIRGLDPLAVEALSRYPWPGNVRELENVIERAMTLESSDRVSLHSLPSALADLVSQAKTPAAESPGLEIRIPAPEFSRGPLDLDSILGDVERRYLLAALDQAGGIKKKAAELLGITFRSIRYRIKKQGISPPEE